MRRSAVDALLRSFGRNCRAVWQVGRSTSTLSAEARYQRWIEANEPKASELERQRSILFTRRPKFSLLVDARNAQESHLNELVASVLRQTYDNWEIWLVTNGGNGSLSQRTADDARVHTLVAPAGQGSSAACDSALARVGGDFAAVLGPSDTLPPFALFEIARAIERQPGIDFIYSDEDQLDESGMGRSDPLFKPDWSPDTLRSHDYVGDLVVVHRPLLDCIGGLRTKWEEAWHYDLVLRATAKAARIAHLPQVLYHRRTHKDREANSTETAGHAARMALEDHLRRTNENGGATVRIGLHPESYQILRTPRTRVLVSILIPNRDQADLLARCVQSIHGSSWTDYEVIIIENHSKEPETLTTYSQLTRDSRVRVASWSEPFNYSAVNNFAATQARGDVLLFLNNDTQVINPDWIERLLDYALEPSVGAVGAKLYYLDDTIQHAGVIVGMNGWGCGHYHRGFGRHEAGYGRRLLAAQNLSAVTGACLMTRRSAFVEVGGFDPNLVVTFNDIDYCLKLRSRGYRVVWTPHSELYHFECRTRGADDTPEKLARFRNEFLLFSNRWVKLLEKGDPYYSPHLTLAREDCSVRIEDGEPLFVDWTGARVA
jgi:O-antigen biosynthesis protein